MAKPCNKLSIMEFRDLKKQYQALQAEMDQALLGAVRDAHFIMGSPVAALEEQLAAYVGVKHCISCANGTDALTLALKAWGIGPGDAVFVPDFTFFSSAEVVSLEGATPVFVDVEEDTFNMDPSDLEHAIQETLEHGALKPRVIVAVDLFGQPADYPRIREIADRYGLWILEDGAQGFGGSITIPDQVGDDGRVIAGRTGNPGIGDDVRMACSFGDIATTSFFPAKPLGCYGDGGAVFTDNDDWAALIRSYRIHGKGTDKYDNVRIGLNSRLDTLQAAVLLVKLKAFKDYELDAVNVAASRYTSLLDGIVETPVVREGFRSSWAQYTLRLRDAAERDAVQAALKTEGIPAMVYYPRPMHAQTAFRGLSDANCPVATQLCNRVLSLPLHPYITEREIQSVADAIRRALKR
jgi:dTDP-4-amino-4,6-dideoxygalactose transaminase